MFLLWWTLWLSERIAVATIPRIEITQNEITMNSHDIKRLRVRTEIIKRYYVTDKDDSHCIYGGPFDTKEEAKQCLEQAKAIDAEPIPLKSVASQSKHVSHEYG